MEKLNLEMKQNQEEAPRREAKQSRVEAPGREELMSLTLADLEEKDDAE